MCDDSTKLAQPDISDMSLAALERELAEKLLLDPARVVSILELIGKNHEARIISRKMLDQVMSKYRRMSGLRRAAHAKTFTEYVRVLCDHYAITGQTKATRVRAITKFLSLCTLGDPMEIQEIFISAAEKMKQ
jgi:hypothetical protein